MARFPTAAQESSLRQGGSGFASAAGESSLAQKGFHSAGEESILRRERDSWAAAAKGATKDAAKGSAAATLGKVTGGSRAAGYTVLLTTGGTLRDVLSLSKWAWANGTWVTLEQANGGWQIVGPGAYGA